MILVIGLGLLVRSRHAPISPFVAKYAGDALWALLVFLGWGWLLRSASTPAVAWISLSFAWTIEFLQLYQAPWIQAVRQTTIGNLALGSTFNAPDLAAYGLGIAIGVVAERLCRFQAAPPRQTVGP
jgi:hypothetical protein